MEEHLLKPNTFTLTVEGNLAKAIICFDHYNGVPPAFMDNLADRVVEWFELSRFVQEDNSNPANRSIYIFRPEDAPVILEFFKRKVPGLLSAVTRDEKWKAYKEAEKRADDLIRCEIYTTSETPCVMINSKVHKLDKLEALVVSVAKEDGFDLFKV